MNDLLEVLFTSDDSGQWNSCVWDPNTSTMVMSYKGGNAAAPHTLSLINNNFVIAADRLKPLLHVWPINSQEPLQGIRMVCPGKVVALDVSCDGLYCAAAIAEKLHIWHLSTGKLLSVTSLHFQPISCIKFTDEGSHIITAGQDGIIVVCNVAYLIQQAGSEEKLQEPLYSFSENTLPVTDLYVGKGGLKTLLVSVSTDRTCRIYDLYKGILLNTVVFKTALSSVTMDILEQSVFVGDVDGVIYQFYLCNAPNVMDGDSDMRFIGHSGSVASISMSADGQTLMSGGSDGKVILWHILSRKMIRNIPLKGAVTNAFYIPAPLNMFTNEFKPPLLNSLAKTTDSLEESPFIVEIMNTDRSMFSSEDILADQTTDSFSMGSLDDKTTIQRLEKINHELYAAAVGKILNKR